MSIQRYASKTAIALRTYPGFKLFLSAVYFTSLSAIAVPEVTSHGMSGVTFDFVVGYWTASWARLCEFVGLGAVVAFVFIGDGLRRVHQKQFGRYRQESVPVGWLTAGRVLGAASFLLGAYVIPFMNLHIPTLALSVGKFAWALSPTVPYFSWFRGDDSVGDIKSLATAAFDRMYFDAAALAPLRSPVAGAIGECLSVCENGPSHQETQSFIRHGAKGTAWGGIDDLFARLSNFLGVPPEHITFHERTTSAVQFAFEEAVKLWQHKGQTPIRVLSTDMEYPGIADELLQKAADEGRVRLLPPVQLRQALESGNREGMYAAWKRALGDSNDAPHIIVSTHVYYGTGVVMDIDALLRAVNEISQRPVVIVDGAQSIGNIDVPQHLFQQVEYYATGAHKWLLVPRHLGILVRNHDLLKATHGVRAFEYPSRPDSSYPIQTKPFSVTISYEPYFGLSSMLRTELQPIRMDRIAVHNKKLADVFRHEVLAIGFRPLSDDSASMVTVSFGAHTDSVHRSLQSNGIKCKLLRLDYDEVATAAIRFCFHFYHGADDVFRLVDVIESEVTRVRAA